MNYKEWISGTYQNFDDPTEWNGQERQTCYNCGDDMILNLAIDDVAFCERCEQEKEEEEETKKEVQKDALNNVIKIFLFIVFVFSLSSCYTIKEAKMSDRQLMTRCTLN